MKGKRSYLMTTRAANAEETKARIRRYAAQVYLEGTAEEFTLEAVAGLAGVAVRTVLRAYPSKEELLDAALVDLGSQVDKLQESVKNLSKPGIFKNVAATSSDSTILTTASGSDAVSGHYEVSITALAKSQVTASTNGFAATSTKAANGGSISFTINGETTEAITITDETTLAELKDKINGQESGVAASIVNTGSAYKLVISGRTTGESNGFVINNSLTNSGGATVAFASGQSLTSGNMQNAQNAALNVNGVDIESTTNNVSGAVPGIALNLVKMGSASVDVTASFDELKSTMKTLVADYNKLRSMKTGTLANDSVMRQVLSNVRSTLLGSNSNSDRYHYLSEIGIEATQTGDLKFTDSKFTAALTDHVGDVKKLFQGSSANGLFNTLHSRLENLDSTAGLIKVTRDSIDLSLKRQRDRIDSQQGRLDIRRLELKQMYQKADETMSRLTQLSSSLSSVANRQF